MQVPRTTKTATSIFLLQKNNRTIDDEQTGSIISVHGRTRVNIRKETNSRNLGKTLTFERYGMYSDKHE